MLRRWLTVHTCLNAGRLQSLHAVASDAAIAALQSCLRDNAAA
jgi:hypothetical protein